MNYHFLQYRKYIPIICRLGQYFVHLMSPSLVNKFLLRMASTSNNHRLQNIFLSWKISDIITSLIPIYDRHRAVHKNKSVAEPLLLESLLHKVNCFLAIKCLINELFYIVVTSLHQHDFQTHYVIRLIIDNKDAPIRIYFIDWNFIFFVNVSLRFVLEVILEGRCWKGKVLL